MANGLQDIGREPHPGLIGATRGEVGEARQRDEMLATTSLPGEPLFDLSDLDSVISGLEVKLVPKVGAGKGNVPKDQIIGGRAVMQRLRQAQRSGPRVVRQYLTSPEFKRFWLEVTQESRVTAEKRIPLDEDLARIVRVAGNVEGRYRTEADFPQKEKERLLEAARLSGELTTLDPRTQEEREQEQLESVGLPVGELKELERRRDVEGRRLESQKARAAELSRTLPEAVVGVLPPTPDAAPAEAAPVVDEGPPAADEPAPPEAPTKDQQDNAASGETGLRGTTDALSQARHPSEAAERLKSSASLLYGQEITTEEAQELLDFLGYDTAGQDAQAEANRLEERITQLRQNFGMFNLLQIIGLILTRGKTADQAMKTFFAQQRITEDLEQKRAVAARRVTQAPKEVQREAMRHLGSLAERDIREEMAAFKRDMAAQPRPASEGDILKTATALRTIGDVPSIEEGITRTSRGLGR